nr:TraV family lipoprotein [Parasulfuritortus cantonensis]
MVASAAADGEPVPLRTRPNTQRIWVAPWQDADGDLHEDAWIVVRLDDGNWMMEHVRERAHAGFSATLKAPPASSSAESREEEPPAAATAVPTLVPALTPARAPAAGAGLPFVPTR